MDAAQAASFRERGWVHIRGAIPPPLLARLNAVLDTHIERWRSGLKNDDGGANGVGSALASSDERLPGADGNRWVSDVGLPLDDDWVDAETGRAVFRELLTLPSVHPVLHEILADEKWGHVLPSIPPELRSGWRLDHDYIEFVS